MMLVTAARHQARPTRLIPAEKASPKCKYHDMMCSFDSCVLCMHMSVLHISSMEGAPFSNRNYHAKPHLYGIFIYIYIYNYLYLYLYTHSYHVLLRCFAKTKTHHANLRRTSQHFFLASFFHATTGRGMAGILVSELCYGCLVQIVDTASFVMSCASEFCLHENL